MLKFLNINWIDNVVIIIINSTKFLFNRLTDAWHILLILEQQLL